MPTPKLFDHRTVDGSRSFADLPAVAPFSRMRTHLKSLRGAVESEFITDDVTEMWPDFTFSGPQFSINNQMGDYWFFVGDPDCPASHLIAVIEHFCAINPK